MSNNETNSFIKDWVHDENIYIYTNELNCFISELIHSDYSLFSDNFKDFAQHLLDSNEKIYILAKNVINKITSVYELKTKLPDNVEILGIKICNDMKINIELDSENLQKLKYSKRKFLIMKNHHLYLENNNGNLYFKVIFENQHR
jgi:predicted MPP superfamily phosphohydrolase